MFFIENIISAFIKDFYSFYNTTLVLEYSLDLQKVFTIFLISSFIGWIVESIYVSIEEKKFISSGSLHIPFIPIYGFGAISSIYLHILFTKYFQNFFLEMITIGIVASIIEYIGSLYLEKLLKIKLWDYSDRFLNINGRVCLLYTIYWIILITFFLYFVFPKLYNFITSLPNTYILIFNTVIGSIFISDVIISTFSYLKFNKILKKIGEFKMANILKNKILMQNDFFFKKFQFIANKFPHVMEEIKLELTENKNGIIKKIKDNLPYQKLPLSTIKNYLKEFHQIADEFLQHPEYQKLNQYPHHNGSILKHNYKVARLAFLLGKIFKLDTTSIARAALCHDFFFYDWHESPKANRKPLHGFYHAKESYQRASNHFSFNDIEKDIITKHMWPLNPTLPKYKETFLVTICDKIVATSQTIAEFKNNRKMNKKNQANG